MKKNIILQSSHAAALGLVTLLAMCDAPPPYYKVVRAQPVYVCPLPTIPVAYSSPVATPIISVYVDSLLV